MIRLVKTVLSYEWFEEQVRPGWRLRIEKMMRQYF